MPWLATIAAWIDARIQAREPGIVTCSALKRAYRDQLAGGRPEVLFVYLKGTVALISQHLAAREGHFMPASLLPTQFETLEEPAADEPAFAIDAAHPVAQSCRKGELSQEGDLAKAAGHIILRALLFGLENISLVSPTR